MPAAPRDLVSLLDLEQIDANVFRGPHPGDDGRRLFGGEVASQALRAAANTANPEHHVNSLHTYFLRPGRFGKPVVYTVDRIRDGGSFTTRRVVASQDGEAILNLDASFHKIEDGGRYQPHSPLSSVPGPETIATEPVRAPHQRLVDTRMIERGPDPEEFEAGNPGGTAPSETPNGIEPFVTSRWVRTLSELPDDPVIHACAITYLADSGPVGTVRRSVGGPIDPRTPDMMTASLDHCLWFHLPARADEWLLYELEPAAAAGARGLAQGRIWTADGDLAVTVTQEALLRWRR